MARALELARRGEALASPNPMVGAVVVRGGRVVGEGFHTYAGQKHAEILALEAAGRVARGATLYVNLEPCCITGRTGPCTDAIIAAGVRRVVAAMRDPNPAVSGRGFRKLRAAGIEVANGPGEAEAKKLNEGFARWICTGVPLVTMKTALTLDGRIAAPRRAASVSRWITSRESRGEVQRMRHAADALVTGIGTVLADDPLLTDRTGLLRRRPLLRVVLDSRLRLPLRSKLVRSCQNDVLVFTTASTKSQKARALARTGVEVVRVRGRGRVDLKAALKGLGRRQILNLLLEGGGQLNGAALAAGIVDKLVLFYAPRFLGCDGVPAVNAWGAAVASLPALRDLSVRRVGPDFRFEGYLRDVYGNR